MKVLGVFLLVLICFAATAQKRKKAEPITYSGCEVEFCYSSHVLYFKADSTVWTQFCAHHPPGCSDFFILGSWKSTENRITITIDSLKNKKRNTGKRYNLGGTYYKIVKPDYEFLIKENFLADTTQLIAGAVKYWKDEDISFPEDEKGNLKRLRSKMMRSYLRQKSWKSGLLVKDVE